MKTTLLLTLCCLTLHSIFSQTPESPCSHNSILARHLQINNNAEEEFIETEQDLQKIITELRENPEKRNIDNFVIPVVMHVFHFGEDGKMGMEQALSGLEILNNDFNGLNDGWDSIDPAFDPIKGSLDITFCLATIDPEGNPTTGIIYHEDENALLNQGDLFQHAWDNYKYLNIYFPKYTQGGPSNFTAYAYYPSTFNSNQDRDGIFYSSIRWGHGAHSELEEGDDWASVCAHEAGHWLDLRHTFQGGCSGGDFVNDTPPTLGGNIELAGCDNNDFSCGEHTNGENFMDYNHRCKKMFTQGQVDRMMAALFLPSREQLWSEANLIETGCMDFDTANEEIYAEKSFLIYPNPASKNMTIEIEDFPATLHIYNAQGQHVKSHSLLQKENALDIEKMNAGIYFISLVTEQKSRSGKFVIAK